ncbi:MAG: hypothetical protein ACK2UR_09365 [Candidatus Promineifilaceae bacterium]|jgi:MFS family permease
MLTVNFAMPHDDVLNVMKKERLYGPLSDRYGRRPLLMVGIGIFISASLMCAVGDLAHSSPNKSQKAKQTLPE